MKGISPIIAIIIILLITIAIAGSAYTYISVVWGGMTGEAIQVTGQSCSGGDAIVYITNTGTNSIRYDTDITLEVNDAAKTVDKLGQAGLWNTSVGEIKAGTGAMIEEVGAGVCDANTFCKFDIIVGGRVYRANVQC